MLKKNNLIYIPGVWDMLHLGHINILEKAKALGGCLIVGVPIDKLVYEDKGAFPIIPLEQRIATLKALKCVDIVVPYRKLEFVSALKNYNIDTLVIGEDWGSLKRHTDALNYMKKNNKKVVQFPYTHLISTTNIKNKIIGKWNEKNKWGEIWEKVAQSKLGDIKVVGGYNNLGEVGARKLAFYFTNKLKIRNASSSVLDYGCGSGVVLKNMNCFPFGIDISASMIKRAIKNNPRGLFLVSDNLPFRGHVDYIICHGVFHYFSSYSYAHKILEQMLSLSNNILICEIPDIAKKNLREKFRKKRGVPNSPKHLYYSRSFFNKLGFKTFDNELSITNNSHYGFSAIYRKKQ